MGVSPQSMAGTMNSREAATATLANCDLFALLSTLRGFPFRGLSPAGLCPQLYAAAASRLENDAHNPEQLRLLLIPLSGSVRDANWMRKLGWVNNRHVLVQYGYSPRMSYQESLRLVCKTAPSVMDAIGG